MKSWVDGMNDAKRAMIREARELSGNNIRKAAELLDIDPSFPHRMIRALEEKDTDPSEPPTS